MHLTDEEHRILDGAFGEPQRIALSVLTKLGDAYGADRMVEIASAHIVGSSYQIAGEAGIEIYGQFVEQGATVKVRTTCDPGSIDFARWRNFKTSRKLCRAADQDCRVARPDGRDPDLDMHPLYDIQCAKIRRGPRLVGVECRGFCQLGDWRADQPVGRVR